MSEITTSSLHYTLRFKLVSFFAFVYFIKRAITKCMYDWRAVSLRRRASPATLLNSQDWGDHGLICSGTMTFKDPRGMLVFLTGTASSCELSGEVCFLLFCWKSRGHEPSAPWDASTPMPSTVCVKTLWLKLSSVQGCLIWYVAFDYMQLMLLSQTNLQELDRLIKVHDEESAKLKQLNELVSEH